MATINDVAKLAGVSRSTVSRAFNSDTSIKQTTKEKVMLAAQKLGYTPSLSARGLAINKKFVIGLFMTRVHEDASTYFSTIISAVNEMLPSEYLLSIVNIAGLQQNNEIINDRFDGAIVFSQSESDNPIIEKLIALHIPTAVVLRKFNNYSVDNVYANEKQAMKDVINYVSKMGHQKIGFINGSPNFTSSKVRREGLLEAVLKNHMILSSEVDKQGEFSLDSGEKLMSQIIEMPSNLLPTCVICASDDITLGALKACHGAHFKLPQKISITGYDDIPYSQITSPSLTTVVNPLRKMAKKGMEFLMYRIKNPDTKRQSFEATPSLLIRNSVKKISQNN
ncbi:LacI family DNA-binding transcriptional regulator [Pediococcus acidilactici]|uniref:LacI family DNA-binding transcriptional regulator n=1 Tax=Pediococcus acidilactici TaxID=1254 RepID=UPI0013254E36|nr:LacI family DNA-binding transcriptional regulator [Pediococcus acidilactici]KAF0516565.1 LacI family DNA-binding transcriptional regulator [Pediococcus acidilactici]